MRPRSVLTEVLLTLSEKIDVDHSQLTDEKGKIVYRILDVSSEILCGRRLEAPEFVVVFHFTQLRTICNTMAMCTKLLVTKINMVGTITTILAKTILSNDEGGIRVGFMFVETLVNEVYMNSHIMGYFNYTITLAEFTRQLVDRLFESTYSVGFFVIENFAKTPTPDLMVLTELWLKAMLSLINYPFENSYISFSTDQDLSDPAITIIPFDWATKLKDPQFFQYLELLACSPNLPPSSSLRQTAICVASKFSSCRMDAVISSTESAPLVRAVMGFSGNIMKYFDSQNILPTDEIIEQLLDQINRIFKLYRVTKLSKQKEEFKHLMHVLVLLSKLVYRNYTDLNNRIFQSLMTIWALIIEQSSYIDFSLGEYFTSTYSDFAETYLLSDSQVLMNLSLPEGVDYENFDKMVQRRFKPFKDLFSMQKESLFGVLNNSIQGLCTDTNVLFSNLRKCRTQRGQDLRPCGALCLHT